MRSARRGPGYVAVAGTIGAGKTSLTEWLSKRYGLDAIFEPHEANPYLADFYRDMRTWAFHSQLSFLSHKLTLHNDLEKRQRRAIVDRSIYEDAEIFATNLRRLRLIDARDWGVYWRLYEGIRAVLRPPDVLIALTCSVATAKKRIAKRGRAMEARIPDAYLRRLHALYGSWFDRYDLSPIVRIDTDRMDYVENLVDMIELTRTLDRWLA